MVERTTVVAVRTTRGRRIEALHGIKDVFLYPNGSCRVMHKDRNGYYYKWYGIRCYVKPIVRFPERNDHV